MINIDVTKLSGFNDIILIFIFGITLGLFLSSMIYLINFAINYIYRFFKN